MNFIINNQEIKKKKKTPTKPAYRVFKQHKNFQQFTTKCDNP
jgi:hypothetical protein